MAVIVLAVILAGPALAVQDTRERTEAASIDFATAEPGHPGYEVTGKGYLILDGDMVLAECGRVQRQDYTSDSAYEQMLEICGTASPKPRSAPDAGRRDLPDAAHPARGLLLPALAPTRYFRRRASW